MIEVTVSGSLAKRFHAVQQASGIASQLSGTLMAGRLARREGQRFLTGFRSGVQGGGVGRERVSGTTGAADPSGDGDGMG